MVTIAHMSQAERRPYEIADYLVSECRERGENLTNLKLQKLLYYADAWHLALYDEELFAEQFKAWVHGPVLLSQYHRFKPNQWRPITEDIDKPQLSEKLSAHLDEVVDVFGPETAVALELMTHRELPWIAARGDLPPTAPSSATISKETTKHFYRSMHGNSQI
ncbi:DUF4065 domain-containing protein [Sphingopyxis soli]|uniref:DUF4065 domain-containing protein n=1 Tax=Sphingopyxis soli TaxID=592051 RepID=A0ABN1MC13_9SPHN|nr:type II toxin-antitoxin system antitoxin SocA domain-containing protein [Sphingopyxis soli]